MDSVMCNDAMDTVIADDGIGPMGMTGANLLEKTREALEHTQEQSLQQQRRLRQKDAIFTLMLEKFKVFTFEYDIRTDEVFYTRMLEDQQCVEQRKEKFRNFFLNSINDETGKRREILDEMLQVCHAPMAGTIEYSAILTDPENYRWYRTAYQSLADEEGNVYAIAGYTEDINDEVLEHNRLVESVQRDSLTHLYNAETVEKMIDQRLQLMQSGEKGVLFVLGLDSFQKARQRVGGMACDGYLRAVAESVRADFRGADILGRIGEDEFVVFICGRLSIDIIEKRAQHIIDLFLRVQLQEFRSVSCGMGIAATNSQTMSYAVLRQQAGKALQQAKSYGANRYRMFDDDKY